MKNIVIFNMWVDGADGSRGFTEILARLKIEIKP